MQSLKDVGVLIPQQAVGTYTATKAVVDSKQIVYALANAIITNEKCEYMTWEEIIHHLALFPFEIKHVTQADLAACDRFALERIGDNVVIRMK